MMPCSTKPLTANEDPCLLSMKVNDEELCPCDIHLPAREFYSISVQNTETRISALGKASKRI